MRILYFYQYFTTPKGAYSTRAYEFARRWVKEGHDVTVVTTVYDQSDLEPQGLLRRMEIDGIDIRLLGVGLSAKHGLSRRVASFALYALVSSWFALTAKYDVALCSSGPITVGLPGLLSSWVRRKPMVFEVRDLWPEGAIQLGILRNPTMIYVWRTFEKWCYRAASRVVALSPGMADAIVSYCRGKLSVIPNAADIELADRTEPDHPSEAVGRERVLLYAGAIGLINDCRQLVDLARELRVRGVSGVRIDVIGDGAERAALEATATTEGLSNIRFLGLRPKKEVFRRLHRATLSLFTVKDTEFLGTASPNKVFDALATATPVIQTSQGWIKDLLDKESCGATVDGDDPKMFAEVVLSFLDDPEKLGTMSVNARRTAERKFDRSTLASEMLAILVDAAQSRTDSAP